MYGYVKYQQPYVHWHPPQVTPEQEIDLGAHVARVGKTELKKKFREGRWIPQTDPTAAATPPPKASYNSGLLALGFVILVFGVVAVLALPFALWLILVAVVMSIWIYSYYLVSLAWAVHKYDRWLSHCLERFQSSQQPASCPFNHILSCRCGQKLRIPARKGRLRVRCPACGDTSYYDS
jgi:hypothetical protein